jgi:hypothetical protein
LGLPAGQLEQLGYRPSCSLSSTFGNYAQCVEFFRRATAQVQETWVTHPLDLDIGEALDLRTGEAQIGP